jgi:hypothetical protein
VQFISDFLLGIGALAAAIYCLVLSRRLQKFTQLESGMGGAIAVLSAQVDDMTKALDKAQAAAKSSVSNLESMTGRAEGIAEKLELLLASMHDLPEPKPAPVVSESAELARKLRVVRSRPHREDMEAAE